MSDENKMVKQVINVGEGDNTGKVTIGLKIAKMDACSFNGVKLEGFEFIIEGQGTATDVGQKDVLDYLKTQDQQIVAGVKRFYDDYSPTLLKMFQHVVDMQIARDLREEERAKKAAEAG